MSPDEMHTVQTVYFDSDFLNKFNTIPCSPDVVRTGIPGMISLALIVYHPIRNLVSSSG